MPRKKLGKLTRKNRREIKTHSEAHQHPQCFVVTRGNAAGPTLTRLMQDFRSVMEPNTASRLRNTKNNSLKDYVAVASTLHVTHLVIFSQTKLGFYIKLCRLPHGPTLTFRVNNFASCKDVLSTLKKQHTHPGMFLMGPCLMTNLQTEEGSLHLQLAGKMFLDMFPTITPHEAKTKSIQRCCLIHYDDEEEVFDFRHYAIQVVPVGLSKAVKKFKKRKLPDLSGFSDVSDFMTKSGLLSESEAEDDPSAHITVPPTKKTKKLGPQKSSVRLSELGPRLTLQLLKIEEGLLEGKVLHSGIFTKTAEEKLALENRRRVKKQLKARRKKEQEENVEAKKKLKEEHKKKCLDGMKFKKENKKTDAQNEDVEADDDDDAQYFREEVGQEPDQDLFQKRESRTHKRKRSDGFPAKKKFRRSK